jgi:hypothetical protein
MGAPQRESRRCTGLCAPCTVSCAPCQLATRASAAPIARRVAPRWTERRSLSKRGLRPLGAKRPRAGGRGRATSRRRRVTASPAIAQSPVQPRRRTRSDTRHVGARTRPDEPRGGPLQRVGSGPLDSRRQTRWAVMANEFRQGERLGAGLTAHARASSGTNTRGASAITERRMARMDSGGRRHASLGSCGASTLPTVQALLSEPEGGLRSRGLGGRAGRRRGGRLPRNRSGRRRTGRRRRPRWHGPVGRTPHPRGAVPDPLPRHVNGPWRRLARGRSRDGVRGRRRGHDVAAGQRQADSEQRREHDRAPATEPARGRRSPDGHGAAGRYWQTCWV